MKSLYLCPQLVDRDPRASDFDGGGHLASWGVAGGSAPTCETCGAQLVAVTDQALIAWTAIVGGTDGAH